MSAPEESFPTAVVRFPAGDGALLTLARNVYDALFGNAKLPDPDPPLPQFLADIEAYRDAQDRAALGGKGKAKARNAKRKVVKADLHHLCDYVQKMAELAGSPADAAALIERACLSVKRIGKYDKPELAAKQAGVSGRVRLDARAVAHDAVYYFEYSADQVSWKELPAVMRCKVLVDGLTAGVRYYFRFHAMTRKGPRDYSQVVSIIVV